MVPSSAKRLHSEDIKSHMWTLRIPEESMSSPVLVFPPVPTRPLSYSGYAALLWIYLPWAPARPSVCPSDISPGVSGRCLALCVGFCSSRRDAQSIPQTTQTPSRITSRLRVQPVSIAQWQQEIMLFMEGPGDRRHGLVLLRLSISQVLSATFYFKRDLRARSNIKYWGRMRFYCLAAFIFRCKRPVPIAAVDTISFVAADLLLWCI